MTRAYFLGLLPCVLVCGSSLAQVEVATTPGIPPHPIYDILRYGADAALGPDNGVCVTGGSISAVRFDGAGSLVWETRYDWDPALLLSLRAESIQSVTTSEGWIIGAAGSSWIDPKRPDCFPLNDALIRIKESGELLWGIRFAGDHRDDYVGYKYPPNIQVRELPDGSFFAVATRVPRREEDNCERPCSFATTGVAVRVSSDGTPIFAREYGYAGNDDKSEILFADLAVVGESVWVLGTVDADSDCSTGSSEIRTLLIEMDFDGNVLRSFEFDRAEISVEGNWASAICSIDDRLYFSFVDRMSQFIPGDSTIACFETSSGTLAWANVYHSFRVDYGTLEPGNRESLIAGGHAQFGYTWNHACEIDTATGFPNWQMHYKDPAGFPNYLGEIVGAQPGGPAGGYWLVSSSWQTGIYMLGTDSFGKTVCSSTEDPVFVDRAEVKVKSVSVQPFRDLPTVEFKPDTYYLPTDTLDPCRR